MKKNSKIARMSGVLRMKKKKAVQKTKEVKDVTIGDMLNDEVIKRLKHTKQQLKEIEERKMEEEARKRREERKQREKNKSFAELLNESDLDWKDFK